MFIDPQQSHFLSEMLALISLLGGELGIRSDGFTSSLEEQLQATTRGYTDFRATINGQNVSVLYSSAEVTQRSSPWVKDTSSQRKRYVYLTNSRKS